jgi:type III restriction enzyme
MAIEITEKNLDALKPLYKPWEEPTCYRAPGSSGTAQIMPGRRPSKCPLVRAIRAEVDAWRRGGYSGVSETSRTLLHHWFHTEHTVRDEAGNAIPFRYHWAQREAIETIIYLYELRSVRNVASLLTEFGGEELYDLALGIRPDEDRWARYCCKMATGSGKTKVMSLAIVWSYFHSLYESGSDLARHFVLIAPNLTVYERLKDDFENGAIFFNDPLIPDEWRGDFQMQVILQDEPGGAVTQGALYLTNIHRLYETRTRRKAEPQATDSLLGPPVQRARALATDEALRARITAHDRIMILNDEAHHLHDPDLAWNRAIDALHDQSLARGKHGICLQLDFTATPKHNNGELFRHIICDFPLGEAVDAGIVKVPVLGESEELTVQGDAKTPAYIRYTNHLRIGYERYKISYEELEKTRKPILFVMTEDAQSANEIANYLDSDEFPLLKGRVLNIHTRLKGKIKTVQRGGREVKEFVESETEMSPEDLRLLREMSRDLDKPDSPYRCVVSVMMLREGWDVRNVTVIVPLRPYSAKSGILPEQTLGRGLRRMFPNEEVPEIVTVVEHPAFRRLYEDELAQEGLDIAVLPIREAFKQTVSIFVDDSKPIADLDIEIPILSDAIVTTTELTGLTFEEVKNEFQQRFKPLPIDQKREESIQYAERHLFTNEIIAQMQLDSGLLGQAWSAPSYFAQMLGRECHISNPHQTLAPLIERFIAEVLFERPVDIYSGEVDHRMRDADVQEHIRATFTPLILRKVHRVQARQRVQQGVRLSRWKPYQATSTPDRPAVPAKRTLFNLVPCDNDCERIFVDFCEYAHDVAAFAKNAGPQKLMIDYLRPDGYRALYVPDFFVRLTDGSYLLCELKGRVDSLVPFKARAAMEWCEAASKSGTPWRYLYIPCHLLMQTSAATMKELARVCEPALQELLQEARTGQTTLPLDEETAREQLESLCERVFREAGITEPAAPIAEVMRQAIMLLNHAIQTKMPNYAHAFQPLLHPLDVYSSTLLERHLRPRMPSDSCQWERYFLGSQSPTLQRNGRYLQENLAFGRPMMRLGTLLFCLHYAAQPSPNEGGVWQDVVQVFSTPEMQELYTLLAPVNRFRNTRVAHVEQPLNNPDEAWDAMRQWLRCLNKMAEIASSF